jgi:hypothetical protein
MKIVVKYLQNLFISMKKTVLISVLSMGFILLGLTKAYSQSSCCSKPTAKSCAMPGQQKSEGLTLQKIDFSKYQNEKVELQTIENTEPLKAFFNQNKHEQRFVALLSAECKECINGAAAIRESILDKYPAKDISIAVVWVDMVAGDDKASALQTAKILNDPRISHYYDANNIIGRAFAQTLGASPQEAKAKPAWDIYMFYPKGESWTDLPPKPNDYTHQLKSYDGKWIDPNHYYYREDMYRKLAELAARY